MNVLIPLSLQQTQQESEIKTVNARDLHAFLGVGKDFSTWIKDRISKYNLVENQDFLVFPNFGENPKGGRPAIDYFLTLDIAKEISMAENNEKGKQARQYFIECERQLKESRVADSALDMLSNPAALRDALLSYSEKVIQLETKVQEDAPKVEFYEKVTAAPDALTVSLAAKTLGVGRNNLMQLMRKVGWVTRANEPYQAKITAGLLDVKLSKWEHAERGIQESITTLITGKGLTRLKDLINS